MEYKWKEATLLVSLLRAALDAETPDVPEDVDWENLCALAVLQRTESMVCAALSGVPDVPQQIMDRLNRAYKKEIAAYHVRRSEGLKILNAFEVNGVDCVPLKGWVLQDLYPNPAMRYMCDLDILFKPEQSADVQRVLEALDYIPQELGGNPEVYFKKPIMNIEMHKAIVRDKTDYYDRIWERVVLQKPCEHTYHMTDEDFYLYMIAHFYKHFVGGGTGVRYVCDTEVFLRAHGDTLDRAYVDAQLQRSGYLDFERQVRALCRAWFHGEPIDEALTVFSKKMLFSGVFGTPERAIENTVRSAVEHMPGKSVQAKKLRYILSLLFPPLSVMRDVYTVLRKLPFLLPLFWIVRGIQRLFSGRDRARELLQHTDSVSREISAETGREV
ncbi:MAG: nucleotidyltransferase family protein [Clostridia bacterium]|nr:nucleotidyltransferase family protein [Clostridia bacterium]